MTVFVAFLRGVNVAGHRTTGMAELKRVHEEMGHARVETSLQSGNVIFESEESDRAALIAGIEAAYEAGLGIRTDVLLRDAAELAAIVERCPFPLTPDREAKFLQVVLLSARPESAAVARLAAYDGPESLQVEGDTLYAYYPEGVGRSKLTTAFLAKTLEVKVSGRNWNTINRLLALTAQR